VEPLWSVALWSTSALRMDAHHFIMSKMGIFVGNDDFVNLLEIFVGNDDFVGNEGFQFRQIRFVCFFSKKGTPFLKLGLFPLLAGLPPCPKVDPCGRRSLAKETTRFRRFTNVKH